MVSYVFTSIAANYVPKARVLLESLRRHDPRAKVVLVLVDRIDGRLRAHLDGEFDEVIPAEDLSIPEFRKWMFGHTVVEACTAVKGFALVELLSRAGVADVTYLDPDIALFGGIDSVRATAGPSDIMLTPHLLVPEDERLWIERNEITALKHGTFNLGFLMVRAGAEGRRFAAWWRDRLHWYCRADFAGGLFTDQRWADLVPSFFPTAAVLRDPGLNVATWNIRHRPVTGDLQGGFSILGGPLRFFHFSGLDSGAQKLMLDLSVGTDSPAHAIRDWYLAACARQDFGESRLRWAYGSFDNGTTIPPEDRQRYRQSLELQAAFPDPFAAGTGFGAAHE